MEGFENLHRLQNFARAGDATRLAPVTAQIG